MTKTTAELQKRLLDWYAEHKRSMPWRAERGRVAAPYHVWLSEIMLQQTTIAAVVPYFTKFTDRWPAVSDLARADIDDVLQMWAGLGYYARARNLHACAQKIMVEHKGRFPSLYDSLLKLPGIGPYTAAAIASIAFGQNVTAVDGNVERVMARFHALKFPLNEMKSNLRKKAEEMGRDNPSPPDFTQAFMELGATICTPKSPKCTACPWRDDCAAHILGIAADLPVPPVKKIKPKRQGTAYWIENDKGQVLLRRRPEKGLLGGMMEFPSVGWDGRDHADALPRGAVYRAALNENVRHIFTHFELTLKVERYSYRGPAPSESYKWVEKTDLRAAGLPSLMGKVLKLSTF